MAAIIHELGHLCALRMLGGKIKSLRLTMVGAEMVFDCTSMFSYMREALSAFAGPAINLLLALIMFKLDMHSSALVHACLGSLNMIPIYPLDGGRVLACCLSSWNVEFAEKITYFISLGFSGLILGLGIAAWIYYGNISLAIGAVWLVISVIKE